MAELSEAKRFALDWVDQHRSRLSEFCAEIWRYAEPAWREYRSAAAYRDLLTREGFTVEAGSGEMPTAFVATWGAGRPVLGAYAEYDAVPGNSQQVVPYPAPREGLHPCRHPARPHHPTRGPGPLPRGVRAAHRGRHRRREVGGAPPAARLRPARRPPLARIHPHRARRGMVAADANRGRRGGGTVVGSRRGSARLPLRRLPGHSPGINPRG